MTYSHTITSADETVRAQAVEPLSRAAAELPPLIWPESAEFDVVRQAWNLHSEQRPACVCVATRVEHVQAAVAFARANGLRVAAQTTGHLSQTLPSLERTLLLKLRLHDDDVTVDPVARVAASRPAPAGETSSTRSPPTGWPRCMAPRPRSA